MFALNLNLLSFYLHQKRIKKRSMIYDLLHFSIMWSLRILIGVSVVFFFSWAPLNIFNIVDLLVKTSTDPGTQVFPAAISLFLISWLLLVWNFEKSNFRRQCWSSSRFSTSLPWALSAPTPSCKEGSLLIVIMVIFMAITIMSLHKKPDWSWFDLEKMSQVFDWNVRNQSSANKCFSINSKIGLTLHRMHQITFPSKFILGEAY